MPITSQATGEKYVPQSIETHPRRIQLREEAELRRIEFEKLRAVPSVHKGPSTRKILLIICAVGLVSAAAGGGAAAAIILTQQKTTSAVGSITVSSGTTTNTNAATTTAAAATTVTGVTTVTGATTAAGTTVTGATTTAAAATTAGPTTSGTTTAAGARCPALGGLTSYSQLSGPPDILEEQVNLFNNFTLTNATIDIYSQRSGGISYAGYNSVPSGFTFSISSINTTYIRSRFQLNTGATVTAQAGTLAFLTAIYVPSSSYVGAGDLFIITATCQNGTTSIVGYF